jgi:hypothetical protein
LAVEQFEVGRVIADRAAALEDVVAVFCEAGAVEQFEVAASASGIGRPSMKTRDSSRP